MKSCRLCLVISEETFNIFKSTSEVSVKNIEDCVNIRIDKHDTLPKRICSTCHKKVKEWIIFSKQCHEVDSILSKIKKEKQTILIECSSTPYPEENNEPTETDNEEYEKSQLNLLLNDKTENIYNNGPFNTMDADGKNEHEEENDVLDSDSDTDSTDAKIVSFNIWSCEICTQEFKSFFEYLDHQPTHDGESVFNCNRCEMVFVTRESLLHHDKNHGTVCKYCGKTVLSKSLKNHLNMHSNKFSCSVCFKKFSSPTVRDQHYYSVHTNIKNHVCETCGKKFSALGNLRLHMRIHLEERRFVCKECPYAGRTASALYAHTFTHSNEKSYICEICANTFKNPFHLNRHKRAVHEKIKRFKCSYCRIEFYQKSKLIVHTRCHTGEKPYKCKECGKMFKRQDALKEHGQVHETNAFVCDRCGKTFRYKRSVRRHVCVPNEQKI